MSLSPPRAKNPKLVANGLRTAVKRWGPVGQVVHLNELDPVTRQLVEAILLARRNAESNLALRAEAALASVESK